MSANNGLSYYLLICLYSISCLWYDPTHR